MYNVKIQDLCTVKNMLDKAETEENYQKLFMTLGHLLLVQLCNYSIPFNPETDVLIKGVKPNDVTTGRREMSFVLNNLDQISQKRKDAFYKKMVADIDCFEAINLRIKECPFWNLVEHYRLKKQRDKVLEKRYSYDALLACVAQKYYRFSNNDNGFIVKMMRSISLV